MNFSGPNYQPIRNNNKYINIFFVLFFFFSNLILLNVFLGVAISNFKNLKEIATGEAQLTTKQKMWLSIKTQIYRLKPLIFLKKPENIIRMKVYFLVNHKFYRAFQICILVLYLLTLSFYKSNMPQKQQQILMIIQEIFVGISIINYGL